MGLSFLRLFRGLNTRRRRRQKCYEKSNRLDYQNNIFARASRVFAYFLAVVARLRHLTTSSHQFWGGWEHTAWDNDFPMQPFFKNSNINIVLHRTAEAGEMKFETKWIYSLRDVFATVVVVVRLSYWCERQITQQVNLILVCFNYELRTDSVH